MSHLCVIAAGHLSRQIAAGAVRPVDGHVLAIAVWSCAHGYASLWLDGQFDHRSADPALLAREVAAMLTQFLTSAEP